MIKISLVLLNICFSLVLQAGGSGIGPIVEKNSEFRMDQLSKNWGVGQVIQPGVWPTAPDQDWVVDGQINQPYIGGVSGFALPNQTWKAEAFQAGESGQITFKPEAKLVWGSSQEQSLKLMIEAAKGEMSRPTIVMEQVFPGVASQIARDTSVVEMKAVNLWDDVIEMEVNTDTSAWIQDISPDKLSVDHLNMVIDAYESNSSLIFSK